MLEQFNTFSTFLVVHLLVSICSCLYAAYEITEIANVTCWKDLRSVGPDLITIFYASTEMNNNQIKKRIEAQKTDQAGASEDGLSKTLQ